MREVGERRSCEGDEGKWERKNGVDGERGTGMPSGARCG